MENIPSEIRPLPTPAGYRQTNPAVLPLAPVSVRTRLFHRKRLVIGFGIAAALHVGLVLAWWLTPPLRLKASYAPERWVTVLPLPVQAPAVVPPPASERSGTVSSAAAESTIIVPAKKPRHSRKTPLEPRS